MGTETGGSPGLAGWQLLPGPVRDSISGNRVKSDRARHLMSSSSHPCTYMHRCIQCVHITHAESTLIYIRSSHGFESLCLILILNVIYNNIIHPLSFVLDILVMAPHSCQPSTLHSPWLKFPDGHIKILDLKKKKERCISKVNNNPFVARQLKEEIFTFPEHITSGIPLPQPSVRFLHDFRNSPVMLQNSGNTRN